MAPILQILGFSIQTAPLAVLLGYSAGLWLSARLASMRNLDGAAISDAGFYGVLAGLLGARLGYVVVHWPAYAAELLSALMPSLTALLPWTGWPVGLIFAGWYVWRKGLWRVELIDVLAPGVALFAAGLAMAAYLNGDAFGTQTALPWGVSVGGALRHPVQLYECLALIVVVTGSVVLLRRNTRPGSVALSALAAYAFARVFVDGFRADSAMVAGLRVTQVAGVVIGGMALWTLGRLIDSPRAAAIAQPSHETAPMPPGAT